MPAPERTTIGAIVLAGREIVEEIGVSGLTMQAVAGRVGVRAPSLYKRIRDRDELIRRIVVSTVEELGDRLAAAARSASADAEGTVAALAREHRAFASEWPKCFALVFGPLTAAQQPDLGTLQRSSVPVVDAAARLAGPDHGLDAARMLTAWANGFVLMELAGAFRLGGDVDAAFEWGLARMITSLRS